MSGILPLNFSQFQSRHAGEAILVCGCGHSLLQLRSEPEITTIGVNDVGRYFDPTYLVVANRAGDFKRDRFVHVRESRANAVFSPFALPLANAPLVKFELTKRSGTDCTNPKGLPFTRNSPYIALCLAAFLGAKRIGLLGVDFTANHFFAASGTHPLAGEFSKIDSEYSSLGNVLNAQGVEVVNLSEESRLTALPKATLEGFLASGSPSLHGGLQPSPLPQTLAWKPGSGRRREIGMKITVERRQGVLGTFFDTLAKSLKKTGATVERIPGGSQNHGPVTFVWNGRATQAPGAIVFCEHGWLPRWHFQMSPMGINANSHCAPFQFDGSETAPKDLELVANYLAQLRVLSPTGPVSAHDPALSQMPKTYLLVPLQIEQDTNIRRHVPKNLRRMQGFIDFVSWHNPNLPILFKQHPADARRDNRHLRLKTRRPQDFLLPHIAGNIHQFLKAGGCKGIIALNSNTVHDGLIWDVPSAVLGRNTWPRTGPSPFLRHIPKDWNEFEAHYHQTRSCREAYCLHLIRNQWSLEDIANPEKVRRFLLKCPLWLERIPA